MPEQVSPMDRHWSELITQVARQPQAAAWLARELSFCGDDPLTVLLTMGKLERNLVVHLARIALAEARHQAHGCCSKEADGGEMDQR